jgi:hypothetical protein
MPPFHAPLSSQPCPPRHRGFGAVPSIARTLAGTIPHVIALAVIALPLAACDEDDPPTCRVKASVALPPTSLGDLATVHLRAVGSDFLLSGWDAATSQVRALTVNVAGAATSPELALTLPEPPTAGPWYAAVGKSTPASQLIAIYGVADPAQPGVVPLRFVTVTAGAPATPATPLIDPEGNPVILSAPPPAGTVVFGSSTTGTNALFVAATIPTAAPIAFLVGPDGATQSLGSTLPAAAGGTTTCLTVTASRLAFGVSRVISATPPGTRPRWLYAEITEQGMVGSSFDFDILTNDSLCPVISPTPEGYVAAWQNRVGTYHAEVITGPGGLSLDSGLLKGAVRFGGADAQPPLTCIASAGHDIHITFGSQPPAVERFTRFGIQAGGKLPLPATGSVGLATAWPKNGSTFVTFLETPAAGGAPLRRIHEVECPSGAADAAVD